MNLAIIPARSGSTRIKDKNVIDFCGRPMIAHPLAAARDSGLFDTIHVSTESERYAEIVRGLGFGVDFLRDASMAGDRAGIIDVLRWVVRNYAARGQAFDDVCLIYATAALIEPEDLRRGHALFVEHGRTTPLLAVTRFPAPVQRALKVNSEGVLEPMFPDTWKRHSQSLNAAYHDAGAFFFIGAQRLIDDDVQIYTEMLPSVIPRDHAVDIDEPEDLETAEILYLGREAARARRSE